MKSIYKDFGIYRITNTKNGMSYIGKTRVSFGDRWDSHRAMLRAGRHGNKLLQSEWNRYGEESFEFAVVKIVEDAALLNDLEKAYIAEYRSRSSSYNIHDGGDGGFNRGSHLSEEARRRIGEKNRKNMTGRKANESTRIKMSVSQKARYASWTESDRLVYGRIMAERRRGHHMSEETRRAFSERQHTLPNAAKFTADDVLAIRASAENGSSYEKLARTYDTSPAYIASIVARRRWAHI